MKISIMASAMLLLLGCSLSGISWARGNEGGGDHDGGRGGGGFGGGDHDGGRGGGGFGGGDRDGMRGGGGYGRGYNNGGGYGYRGSYGYGGSSNFGIYLGSPYYSTPYYSYPYASPNYYPPTEIAVPVQPPVYIQQPQQQFPPGYWYYCNNPPGYHPYVKQCRSGWQQVVPNSQ